MFVEYDKDKIVNLDHVLRFGLVTGEDTELMIVFDPGRDVNSLHASITWKANTDEKTEAGYNWLISQIVLKQVFVSLVGFLESGINLSESGE
jgi:hypothetical protein